MPNESVFELGEMTRTKLSPTIHGLLYRRSDASLIVHPGDATGRCQQLECAALVVI